MRATPEHKINELFSANVVCKLLPIPNIRLLKELLQTLFYSVAKSG